MPRTYTHILSMSQGGDTPTWEGEVTVSYEVVWGQPESGRFGPPEDYDPGAGDVVEAVKVTHIDGEPVSGRTYGKYEADALEDTIECSDALLSELLQAATEDEIAAHDDAMERRWEERRLEGF